jgi:HK97 gp10 family phage protein
MMMGVEVKFEERDYGAKAIKKEIKKLKGSYTEIGLFGNGGDASINLAERASIHEYGTRSGKIPSRPFMRNAFDNNKKQLKKFIIAEYSKLLDRRRKAKSVLKKIGAFMEGKQKDSILLGSFVELKPQTVSRKGSTKPLVDTGNMVGSIQHKETMK